MYQPWLQNKHHIVCTLDIPENPKNKKSMFEEFDTETARLTMKRRLTFLDMGDK